ncbi:MAG: universal stress protein [Bacteroidia bacterium]
MENYNLLLVTDYSDAALNAEKYAIEFAKNTHSFLRIMHVFDPIRANEEGISELEKTDYNPAFSESARLKSHFLKTLRALHIKPEDLNFECVVREGSASQQIKAEATEVVHDLIIMGTHGAGALSKLLFGSHTWDVIKKSSTPVLAIPPEARFGKIKELVFATEYREGELPVINFLTQIAAKLQANLTVLHISNSAISASAEKKLAKDFAHELENKITFPNVSIQAVHSPDIIPGIDEFCKKKQADWLIMSPAKRNFIEKVIDLHGSTTKQMSFHTRMPLLSIPDYYNPDYAWFWKLFELDFSEKG